MEYYIYFDLIQTGFTGWVWVIGPWAMLVFGAVFFIYREPLLKLHGKIIPIKNAHLVSLRKSLYGKMFFYPWFFLVLLFGTVMTTFLYGEYYIAKERVLAGQVSVVTGVIDKYEAGPGKRFDTFCVDEICFEITDNSSPTGFHQQQINGSPLKLDTPVRITYIHDLPTTDINSLLIVRLEIGLEN